MMLSDVITQAAVLAGGEPFTLPWLMLQTGVRERLVTDARALSVLREMIREGTVREYARHPVPRWQLLSGD